LDDDEGHGEVFGQAAEEEAQRGQTAGRCTDAYDREIGVAIVLLAVGDVDSGCFVRLRRIGCRYRNVVQSRSSLWVATHDLATAKGAAPTGSGGPLPRRFHAMLSSRFHVANTVWRKVSLAGQERISCTTNGVLDRPKDEGMWVYLDAHGTGRT
jgi:hypothetical protein